MTSPAPAPARRRPRAARRLVLLLGGVLALVGIAAVGFAVWGPKADAASAPGPGTTVVASELSKAARAAGESAQGTPEQAAAEFLSTQPTAYWLTPEADPESDVPARIAGLADEARAQSASLALVVYGLPGRDCGNHSAGGLAPAAYADWTAAIGAALADEKDVQTIVVLEPDSLALAPECGNVDERAAQLRGAVEAVSGENVWIYLDAGHSNWLPVDEMATLISRVGDAEAVRGFATNVSNYNDSAAEIDYAHALSERLDGMHAVIDTSRNGAGSNGEWCNPEDRLVGEAGGSFGDDVVDTNLWIKPPGESDGSCNGGPDAGVWWPEAAVALTREASKG